MRKVYLVLGFIAVILTQSICIAHAETKRYEGSGEVISADPLYSRVTIEHGPISGFSGGPETEFFVTSPAILKDISRRDLVNFVIVDQKGDARIEKIIKTGVAPEKEDGLQVGKAVQGALVSTGEAAKVIASPLPPAHEIVSGTVGVTTDATGSVLEEANPEVKQKF